MPSRIPHGEITVMLRVEARGEAVGAIMKLEGGDLLGLLTGLRKAAGAAILGYNNGVLADPWIVHFEPTQEKTGQASATEGLVVVTESGRFTLRVEEKVESQSLA